jgi:protease-4
MVSTLVLAAFVSFFEAGSAATSRRALALFQNPAGLAIQPGLEFAGDFGWEQKTGRFGLSLGPFGIGITTREDESSFRVGLGVGSGSWLSVGAVHTFGQDRQDVLGLMVRPNRFLSLGGTAIFRKDHATLFDLGIGFRPFTRRITLRADFLFERDSMSTYSYGLALEPLDGVIISATGDKEETFSLGLELSLGTLKLSGKRALDPKETRAGAVFSVKPYLSSMPRPDRCVVLRLDGSYPEDREARFPFGHGRSFFDLLEALERAGDDPGIRAVLLDVHDPRLRFAQAEEIRSTLLDIREKGKTVIALASQYDLKLYYLVSAADRVALTPAGSMFLPGLYIEKTYITGFMEKLGIEADLASAGDYKSAEEIFTRTDMSPEDREQSEVFLEDVFDVVARALESSRGFDRDRLFALIEEGYFHAFRAREAGLVDTLVHYDEVEDFVQAVLGNPVKQVDLWTFAGEGRVPEEWRTDRPRIALVTVEGSLVSGESGRNPIPIPIFGGKYAGSETIANALRTARDDPSIRAVVLRVNSPGGESFTSEWLSREVEITARAKPVVVSMGSLAASGGYDISAFGSKLLADETSLTGSIGVWAGKPVLRKFYEKIGLSTDVLKIGSHADAFSPSRPLEESERETLEMEVQGSYDRFVSRVAEGRGMTTDSVDAVAQGRIWSGKRARDAGLVDSCGGMLDAVRWAKELAGYTRDIEVEIVQLPGYGMVFNYPLGENMDLRIQMFGDDLLYLLPFSMEVK